MKRLFTIFATLLATLSLSANNVVTLAVSGQGATKEEATANALRSAIEQAYGVFVSANTTILNDELVRDEIATVASGNIEKFEEISYVTTSNGEAFVTLSATVAISKLQAYAKSKGSSAEFAGATFAMNMKMRELNKQNEQKALVNMYYQLQELAPNVFDWELTAGYPTIQKDKNYKVPMTLTAKPNDASEAFYNILTNTLNSLSLTPTEIEEYKQVGLETFTMQTPQKVVLRNNPKEIMAYLGYLVYCIESSYRIKQLSADGQTFYAKKAGQKAAVNPDYEYYSQWMGYYKNAGFDAYKKDSNSNIVVRPDVLVGHDEMMILQGFEVEHTPVNRITFKYDDDGELWASDVVVCQDVKKREFDRYHRGLWDKLDNITISDGVTSIGEYAFYECSSLASITIPDSVTSIGDSAFYKCSNLASVTIGNGVTSIGYRAFYDCDSLKSITIPDSVTKIGKYAFYDCYSLKSVHITDIAAWCGIYFSDSTANPLYYANNLYLNGELVTNLVIPDSVTSIGWGAFYDCKWLKSITIPDSVTSIGGCAFYECKSLASVTIPDSVTKIGNYAFSSCTSLTSITIPDSVTSIGEAAFSGCTSLTSISIGNGVTSLGSDAFSSCTSLTSVHITDIAAWCGIIFGDSDANPLYYAHNLYLNGELVTNLVIPDSVTKIGYAAFAGCTSLTSVTIPDSVTSIGDYAFYCCSSLASVYCKPTTPPTGGSVNYYTKIYVPAESVEAYKAAEGWSVYANNIVGYDFE